MHISEMEEENKPRFTQDFYKHVPVVRETPITDLHQFKDDRDINAVEADESQEQQNLGNKNHFMIIPNPDDAEDQEEPENYCYGGFHPVQMDDVFMSRYKVRAKLGAGQFSTVWKCYDSIEQKNVAIKIVRSRRRYVMAGIEEYQILKQISQAYKEDGYSTLLAVKDAFSFESINGVHLAIVTEAQECNLLKLIQATDYKGLPMDVVRSITRQILRGLACLHEKCRILHTDIKPENILTELNQAKLDAIVTDRGRKAIEDIIYKHVKYVQIKIADFSNSVNLDDSYHGCIQTRQYRALEVLIGAKYGTPADIWSVACMSFEMATGRFLFDVHDNSEDQDADRYPDENHIREIWQLLGSIPSHVWKTGKKSSEFYDQRKRSLIHFKTSTREDNNFVDQFQDIPHNFEKLLKLMLAYDTGERVTAKAALKNSWLNNDFDRSRNGTSSR
ncbi:protein kinase domain-containing protein [Ditylenchus destructor]|nr:protein kinase domain-containing protein [Ditylenchus destructor]